MAVLESLDGKHTRSPAVSPENMVLSGDDVWIILLKRRAQGFVFFLSEYLISPVVLYCSDEKFPGVLVMVEKYALPVATVTANLLTALFIAGMTLPNLHKSIKGDLRRSLGVYPFCRHNKKRHESNPDKGFHLVFFMKQCS